MKKLFILGLIFILGMTLNIDVKAQAIDHTYSFDTIIGTDTLTFTSQRKMRTADGWYGWVIDVDTIAGQDTIFLQGTYDQTTYVNIDTAADAATGQHVLEDADIKYLYYRLFMKGAIGDSIIVTPREIYKRASGL